MGYNSGLIVFNDSLHLIAENPLEFTEKVVRAIHVSGVRLPKGKMINIGVKGDANVASLFHMAHADEHQVYVVGGNTAFTIPGGWTSIRGYQDSNQTNIDLVKGMTDAMGYRLVKKRN